MAADLLWVPMAQVRGYLTLAVTPVQWFVDAPSRFWNSLNQQMTEREALLEENARLRNDLLVVARRLQKLDALEIENARLRGLLNAAGKRDERVLLAELIGVSPDPFVHQLILNRGLQDGVVNGLPVLDAGGVMGQVIEVGPYTSRVLLITDTQHAIPVQVNRSGVRSILQGQGNHDYLELEYVPDTADVKKGDLLVSSGMGGRFPVGYPVGVVSEIHHDPGQPFARVVVKPTAKLSKSRHLLLLFPQPETAFESAAEDRDGLSGGLR